MKLLEQIGIVAGAREAIGVQYGTHAAYTSAAGVPSVVFGPGSINQAHTKDEFIEVGELRAAAAIYFSICSRPPASG